MVLRVALVLTLGLLPGCRGAPSPEVDAGVAAYDFGAKVLASPTLTARWRKNGQPHVLDATQREQLADRLRQDVATNLKRCVFHADADLEGEDVRLEFCFTCGEFYADGKNPEGSFHGTVPRKEWRAMFEEWLGDEPEAHLHY